ncbi:MAG: response regulator transcription factor [Crocinitomicaceae bacterium]|jgi:two-component system alkaline phosphatase synthesis response regulator PhoP|tara:strand:- start:40509 stop:41177 length:669 start_codon:yes stop_codon:yes gene_type:complete
MSNKSILVVDDDEDIRSLLTYNIDKAGYDVDAASNGVECLEKIKKNKPNLILMDVMMPEMDGLEVCEQIKSNPTNSDILICFLTARGEDYSQIAALEAGGDDYVTKPIKPKVLLSRINALLRRTGNNSSPLLQASIRIDYNKYIVYKNGDEILLPKKEFELISLLASKPCHVFRRSEILNAVWGTDIIVGDRTIDVHIRKLRRKLGEECIATVKGVGYKLIQ